MSIPLLPEDILTNIIRHHMKQNSLKFQYGNLRLVNRFFNDEILFAHFVLGVGQPISRDAFEVGLKAHFPRLFARRRLQGFLSSRSINAKDKKWIQSITAATESLAGELEDAAIAANWIKQPKRLNDGQEPNHIEVSGNAIFNQPISILICDAMTVCLGADAIPFVRGDSSKLARHEEEAMRTMQDPWMFVVACFVGNSNYMLTVWKQVLSDDNSWTAFNLRHKRDFRVLCLMLLARAGHVHLIRAALEMIGSVRMQNVPIIGAAMLFAAVDEGHISTVEFLLQAGLNIPKSGFYFEEAFLTAVIDYKQQKARHKLVNLLYAHSSGSIDDKLRDRVFEEACGCGDLNIAKLMMNDGIVNVFSIAQESPFTQAISGRHYNCLEFIIQNLHRFRSPDPTKIADQVQVYATYRRACQSAVDHQDLKAFMLLAEGYDQWNSHERLVRAAEIDGGIPEVQERFGLVDLNLPYNGPSRLLHESALRGKLSVGEVALIASARQGRVLNVRHLLNEGVRRITIELKKFRGGHDKEYAEIEAMLEEHWQNHIDGLQDGT